MKLTVVAQGDYVNEAEFVKTEAWFDQSEACAQREQAELFDRVSMIKKLFFEVNKNVEKVCLLLNRIECAQQGGVSEGSDRRWHRGEPRRMARKREEVH